MHGQSRIEMSRPHHHHQSNSSSYMGAPLAITAGPSHEIDPPRSRHSTHPRGYYISTHLNNFKICLLTFDIVFDFKELALIGMLGRETATVLERAATRPQCKSPIENHNRKIKSQLNKAPKSPSSTSTFFPATCPPTIEVLSVSFSFACFSVFTLDITVLLILESHVTLLVT